MHGPIRIYGQQYSSLCDFYVNRFTKRIQKGHACNVAGYDVSKVILSPTLLADGLLLNQTLACVCDVVHWGLTDFALKFMAARVNNRAEEVCSALVNTSLSLYWCSASTSCSKQFMLLPVLLLGICLSRVYRLTMPGVLAARNCRVGVWAQQRDLPRGRSQGEVWELPWEEESADEGSLEVSG